MNHADTDSFIYRIAFSMVRGLMRPVAEQILDRIGSEEAFFGLSTAELSSVNGFSNKIFSDAYRADLLERARREAEYITARQIEAVYFRDSDYPQRMLQCDDAPLMLYAFGRCDLNDVIPLAIVGTRHATAYGVDFVKRLVSGLAARCRQRVVIISGLAFGIDVAAHRAALDAGLPTVAVVAHGLNTIYPAQHRSTAVDIVKRGGMILTEYTSADAIHKGNFLARNRIVAGVSDATVVAESAVKGGALFTARIASAYNRDVFALPGRAGDRWSEGCNRLIHNHTAQLITDADELIESMGWAVNDAGQGQQSLFPELTSDELLVVNWITEHPDTHINDMAVALDIAQGRLNGLLLELEFKGLVIHKPGARYCMAVSSS